MKNTLTILFSILCLLSLHAQTSVQKAVLEVYTGCWSGFSPDATLIVNDIISSNSNVFAVLIHQGDPMSTTEGDQIMNFYGPAFPEGQVNRKAVSSRGQWAGEVSNELAGAAYVTVEFDSVVFDPQTRVLDVFLTASFSGTYSGDLRFNCIVVEDSVIGSTSYNQINYFNSDPTHTYYGAGNPIVGYPHRYVARKYLGGAWGTAGLIPSTANMGTTASHHYSYTIPVSYDVDQISLIAMVQEYGATLNERRILNAERYTSITSVPTTAIQQVDQSNSILAFPNPSNGSFNLSVPTGGLLSIYAADGQQVYTKYLQAGELSLELEVPKGLYLLRFVSERGVGTKKLIIMN
jgi:hypothetical protein